MKNVSIKIKKLRPNAILPDYQTEHSACMDLHACIDEPIILKPLDRALIPTGLSIELPPGYESQIRARSGLAFKNGVALTNGMGTIDADYRGEYSVLMINFGNESFTVQPDMRIAQLLISKYEQVQWDQVDELGETKRGAGGFGSTGTSAK